MTPDMDDARWIAELSARREQAVEALRLRLRQALGRALGPRGLDDDELEDVAQEGTLRVLDRLEAFRGDSRFLTWAVAVAVRVGLTRLRRRRAPTAPLDALIPDRRPRERPAAQAERGELLVALRRAIDEALTDRQRTIILAELAGMPSAELAVRLGTNPNAIYKAYHDARKKLRRALEAAGFAALDVRSALEGASH